MAILLLFTVLAITYAAIKLLQASAKVEWILGMAEKEEREV